MNRQEQIEQLKSTDFDVCIIGGGATGTGVALDAATRGLKVALIERDDFSAGTSSRSTKLIHGGVRYLEQAVKKLDRSQFNLVRDALKERSVLIKIAPHLAKPLALVTPLYHLWQVPYFMTGLKLYDRLAGKSNLAPSYFVSSKEAVSRFPMLKKEGLNGGVVYYDGQFDDARMNVSLALTAVEEGASVANHVEATKFIKTEGKVSGLSVRDNLTGSTWDIKSKVVINATGPFSDFIRHMDDPTAPKMLSASSGIHIVLDSSFSPPDTGLLIPETEDGRVLFLLPWLGHTIVGTTDTPAEIEPNPKAEEDDIDYVLRHVQQYFDVPVSRNDVKATFSGLRPLVSDPKAADTAKLSRDHVINTSDSGLVTIAGGKWTTYRKMALDTIDEAIKVGQLNPASGSKTENLLLVGAKDYSPLAAKAIQEAFDFDENCADYLNRAYGDRAPKVGEIAKDGYGERLSSDHNYIEAEVIYAARYEGACNAIDILARRMRMGFLDQAATLGCVARVCDLLAEELQWSDETKQSEIEATKAYFS